MPSENVSEAFFAKYRMSPISEKVDWTDSQTAFATNIFEASHNPAFLMCQQPPNKVSSEYFLLCHLGLVSHDQSNHVSTEGERWRDYEVDEAWGEKKRKSNLVNFGTNELMGS